MLVLICLFIFKLPPTVLNFSLQASFWGAKSKKERGKKYFFPFFFKESILLDSIHVCCTYITHSYSLHGTKHFNLLYCQSPVFQERCRGLESHFLVLSISLRFYLTTWNATFPTTLMVYDVIHHQVWSGNSAQWLSNPLGNPGLRQSPNVITHERQHFLVRHRLSIILLSLCAFSLAKICITWAATVRLHFLLLQRETGNPTCSGSYFCMKIVLSHTHFSIAALTLWRMLKFWRALSCFYASKTRGLISSYHNHSHSFLLLEAVLLFQSSSSLTVEVNCRAVMLHFRRLWHFLCWGAVAAVVGYGV